SAAARADDDGRDSGGLAFGLADRQDVQVFLGAIHGASSTCLQAAGRSATVIGGVGFGGIFGGLGCSTESLNHQSSSLPQPSPAGGSGCGLHSFSPAGQ